MVSVQTYSTMLPEKKSYIPGMSKNCETLHMQGCRKGGAWEAPPVFDRSVNPISTRGG